MESASRGVARPALASFLAASCTLPSRAWPANDNALRATYCIPVIDNMINFLKL